MSTIDDMVRQLGDEQRKGKPQQIVDNPYDLGTTEPVPPRPVSAPLALLRHPGAQIPASQPMMEPAPTADPLVSQGDGEPPLIDLASETAPPQPSLADQVVARVMENQKTDEEDRQRLADATAATVKMALEPAQAAEVQKYGAVFPEMSSEYIAKHLPEVRAQARAQHFDWYQLVRDHPVYAKLVGDPKTASRAMDDSAVLTPLEAAITGRWEAMNPPAGGDGQPVDDWFTTGGSQALSKDGWFTTRYKMTTAPTVARAIKAWQSDYDLWLWNTQKLVGITPQLPDFNPATGRRYDPLMSDVEEAKARAEYVQYLHEHTTSERNFRGYTGDGAIGKARRVVGDAFLFPVKIAPMIAGAVSAGATTGGIGLGAFAGTMAFNTAYTAPSFFESLSGMENKAGEKMSPTAARVFTFLGAPMLGFVLSKGLGPTFSSYAAAGLEGATAGTAARALAEDTMLKAFGSWGRKAGAHAFEGAAAFAMQAGLDSAIQQLAGSWQLGVEPRPGEVPAAMWSSFKQGLLDMSLLGAFAGGRDLLSDMGRLRRAAETNVRWRVMQNAEEAVKHPEVVAEMYAKTKTAPGSAQDAWIDVNAFNETAVKAKLDPREVMASVMEDGGALYDRTIASNSVDLQVPLEKARKLLRSKDFADFMAEEARFDPADSSFKDASDKVTKWTKLADEAASLPIEQMNVEQRAIYEDASRRIKEANKGNKDVEKVADSNARFVLGYVTQFYERTNRSEPLLMWYDRTFGQTGIFSAKAVAAGEPGGVRLYVPPEAFRFVGQEALDKIAKMPEWYGATGTSRGKHFILIKEDAPSITVAHELTHLYERVLSDLIENKDTEAAFRPVGDELAKALTDGKMDWTAYWDQNGRTHQSAERFARAFEDWILEGKPPSLSLTPSMIKLMQFANSMLKSGKLLGSEAWRKSTGAEGSALNSELRKFFSKILATPDEIRRAQEFVRAGMPIPAITKNMTPEQKAEYAKLMEGSELDAHQLLLKMITDAARRENHAFLKSEFARFEALVRDEIDSGRRPEYAAARFFRGKGEGLSPGITQFLRDAKGRPFHFSIDELIQRFGDQEGNALVNLIKEKFGGKAVGSEEGSLDASQFAQALGFSSDKPGGSLLAMRESLRGMVSEKEFIRNEATARLRDKYSTDLVDNPERLQESAMDAVLNSKMFKKIVFEMNALVREIDPARTQRMKSISPEKYAKVAERLLSKMQMRQIRPDTYARAMAAASAKAREFAKSGDNARAWDALDGALINMEMYKASKTLRADVQAKFETLVEKATSDSWRSKLGMADRRYQAAHDEILKSIQVLPTREGEAPAGGKALDDLAQVTVEHNQEQLVDGWDQSLVRSILDGKRRWPELTPDEASSVYDAITNIQKLAADTNEVRVGEETAKLDTAAEALLADLEKMPFKGKAPADMVLTRPGRETGLRMQSLFATAEEFNTIAKRIGESAKKYLWDPYTERKYFKFDLEQKVIGALKDAFEALDEKTAESFKDAIPELDDVLPIPEKVNLAGPRSRGHLVMIMLQMGNPENQGRLLRGMGWSPEAVKSMAEKYLSPQIMDLVQKIWDVHENILWPLIDAKEFRTKGLPLKKVVAEPFTLTFGGQEHACRGGYFHAKYDQRAGVRPFELQSEGVSNDYVKMKPATYKSYTRGRTANYSDVMDLNWNVLSSHLSEVIHDLAFDEWVRSANKLLFNKKFQIPEALYQRLGEEGAKQPRAFLEATAHNGDDAVASQILRLMNTLDSGRSRVVIGSLGYNAPVAAADLLHPIAISLFGQVPMLDMAATLARAPLDFVNMHDFAISRSKELQMRAAHSNPRMQELIRTAVNKPSVWQRPFYAIRRNAFVFLNAIDQITSTVVWTSKFREALRTTGDEAQAVKIANDTVNSSMPTHVANELPAVLRDHKTIGALLMFQGYWNKLYQMARLRANDAQVAWHDPDISTSAALGQTAVSAMRIMAGLGVASVLGDFVMGHGKEQDESWGQWWGRKFTVAPFSLIPFGANVAEPLADVAWSGKVREISVRQAPFLAAVQMVFNDVGRLASDSREADQKVWDAVELALFAFKLPYRQPRRTGEYLTNLANGDETADDLFAVSSGIIYGKRQRQAANPLDWGNQ